MRFNEGSGEAARRTALKTGPVAQDFAFRIANMESECKSC
jgi:hypothetical protein